MSPRPDRWREFAVSLNLEQEQSGELVARFGVGEPDGRLLVVSYPRAGRRDGRESVPVGWVRRRIS
jgi:hypothetical protein